MFTFVKEIKTHRKTDNRLWMWCEFCTDSLKVSKRADNWTTTQSYKSRNNISPVSCPVHEGGFIRRLRLDDVYLL